MRAPVSASRLPVGSSAKTISGSVAKARAMATRCCSPPDSWRGVCAGARGEADAVQPVGGAFARVGATGQFQRQQDVFQRGQRRQQLERLEHEADAAGAQAGAGVLVEIAEALAEQHDFARGRLVESRQQAQQGGLAGAGRAGDRQRFAGCDGKLDFAQDGERAVGRAHALRQGAGDDERRSQRIAMRWLIPAGNWALSGGVIKCGSD